MNWMIIMMSAYNDDGTSYTTYVKLKFEKLKNKYGSTGTLTHIPSATSGTLPVTIALSIPSANILDAALIGCTIIDLPNVTTIKRPITPRGSSSISTLNMPLITELPNDCFNVLLENEEAFNAGPINESDLSKIFYNVRIFGDRCFKCWVNNNKGNWVNPLILPPQLKYIGDYCFYESSAPTTGTFKRGVIINLPDTIEHIGNHAMQDFSSINISKLPSNLKYVGDYALARTAKKTDSREIFYVGVLPNNLSHIGNYAFYQWYNLIASNIPTNITYIGEGAFAETDVTITSWPGKLNTIKSKTFMNCLKLKTMTIGSYGSPMLSIASDAFQGCTNITQLIIYTTAAQPIPGAPWGATNANVIYRTA